jgi:hypothetical protein
VALAVSVTVLGTAVYALGLPDDPPGRPAPGQAALAPAPEASRTATPTPTPTASSAAPAATTAPPAPPPATAPAADPTHGPGTFTVATGAAAPVGHGTVRRYRVEVEDGSGVDPQTAAAQVQSILADRRGWTNDGKNGFQLVSTGPYDFTVKIATPDTADRICAGGGLNTRGEVNCDVGEQVVVNLKRWNTGSPQFTGPIEEYRALIVNHEVGHRIGHGHETCPGKGKPAPAMMQQIYGLKGCVANAWPYSDKGVYLGGPAVP